MKERERETERELGKCIGTNLSSRETSYHPNVHNIRVMSLNQLLYRDIWERERAESPGQI